MYVYITLLIGINWYLVVATLLPPVTSIYVTATGDIASITE